MVMIVAELSMIAPKVSPHVVQLTGAYSGDIRRQFSRLYSGERHRITQKIHAQK